MWIAPPSGLRFISAATTASVSFTTSSRTRADAAPWPPLTARNALVIAMRDLRRLEAARRRRCGGSPCTARSADRRPQSSGFPVRWPTGPSRDSSRTGGSARDLHGSFSCRNLVVVIAIAAFRAGRPPLAQGRGGCGRSGDVFGFPGGRAPRRESLPGRVRILLANQNLLHLVFKWLMSTKHSGEVGGLARAF